jgi:hypothetical protein
MGLPGTSPQAVALSSPTAQKQSACLNLRKDSGILVIVRSHTTQTAEPSPTAGQYRQFANLALEEHHMRMRGLRASEGRAWLCSYLHNADLQLFATQLVVDQKNQGNFFYTLRLECPSRVIPA